jgi:sugar phosphate isomerase/epimerase
MQILLFTKALSALSVQELASLAHSLGIDGYDMCVRQGCQVQPEDVDESLPQAVDTLASGSIRIGMISGPGDLTDPASPLADKLCRAMARSGVPLLKIGYFPFNPLKHHYLPALEDARKKLAGWAALAQSHKVKVCYHTHINNLGSSAGVLSQMLADLPPQHISAYLDPAQLLLQGEGFATGMAILQGRVSVVGFKDVFITRHSLAAHGGLANQWVFPGQGMVDWSLAAQALRLASFTGPISLHVLMHNPTTDLLAEITREVAFYRNILKDNPA